MYSLGKFLKFKYYDLLLNGDPQKIYVRSTDLDRCLSSAAVLVSGLDPPKDRWVWSNELPNWQPIAIHSVPLAEDDLLYPHSYCPEADAEEDRIRNSSIYGQYLSEYKHDLQTLYEYTGNDKLQSDLTQAEIINDALMTRQSMPGETLPPWYTPAFAKRLAHIADKTDQIRFSTTVIQRLRAGRILNEIIENIKSQIAAGGSTVTSGEKDRYKVQVYVTHDQTLIALMNSLQIYTGIPYYGTALIIELHYDPVVQVHFLRFFMISSHEADIVPEPVRVNPPICGINPECDTVKFEQSVQHLSIDRNRWLQACQTPSESAKPMIVGPIEPNGPIMPVSPYGLTQEAGAQPPPTATTGETPGQDHGSAISSGELDSTGPTSIPGATILTPEDQPPALPTTADTSITSPESDNKGSSTTTNDTALSAEPSPSQSSSPIPSQGESASTTTTAIPSSISNLQQPPQATTEVEVLEPEKGPEPMVVPSNQLDNGIVMSPMLNNMIKSSRSDMTPSLDASELPSTGIRPSTVTTRDVYVPMEANSNNNNNQHRSPTDQTKLPELFNDDLGLNEVPEI